MKAAIISDIHSNLEALQAVIKDIKKRRIKNIFCLGDIVGYGANPNECMEICIKEADIIIAGNHDWATVEKTDVSNFNKVAATAVKWTKERIKSEHAKKLQDLPLTYKIENLLLVHSAPEKPEEWHYLFNLEEFERQFQFFNEQICFIGHSHIPTAVYQDDNGYTDFLHENPFPIIKKRRYIINVGSVGQPRDLDPRGCYVIYDGNKNNIEFVRIEYNIPLASQKIIEAGLPEILSERLLVGK
uniref:Metallophosphoesterase n=1 Tax=candidate division WOR-3 bacterium TaxID=2052148 RepID=A0A7C4X9A3_UNCW3